MDIYTKVDLDLETVSLGEFKTGFGVGEGGSLKSGNITFTANPLHPDCYKAVKLTFQVLP